MTHERAGTLATPADLVDVAHLVTAYYTGVPDPDNLDQQVAFGTSGTAARACGPPSTRPHPGHDPGDRRLPRSRRASTGRCSSVATPTGCPSRPGLRRWRCWRPMTSPCWSTTTTATPRRPGSRTRSCGPTAARSAESTTCRAASGWPTASSSRPSHNPPSRRWLQVQPAARRAGRHRCDQGHRGCGQRLHPGRVGRGEAGPVRASARCGDGIRLPGDLRRRPAATSWTSTRSARPACGSAPTRSAVPASTTGARSPSARARPHRRQPARRPDLALHDAGLGRQDPDGLLVAVGDGLAHRQQATPGSRPATTPTPTGTASSRPTGG
jgi:hypothetical protein